MVYLLRSKHDDSSNWFVDGAIRRVGPFKQTSYWKDPWLGSIPLETKFTSLFLNSVESDGLVREIG